MGTVSNYGKLGEREKDIGMEFIWEKTMQCYTRQGVQYYNVCVCAVEREIAVIQMNLRGCDGGERN